MNNSGSGLGAFVLFVVVMLGFISLITPSKPDCSMYGCDNSAKEVSSYCSIHGINYRRNYIKQINNSYYGTSQSKSNSTSGLDSSSTKNTINYTTNKKKSTTKSNKKYNTDNSYDEGYEDLYENDEYDLDRYYDDDDYAAGVDDAMDELDW